VVELQDFDRIYRIFSALRDLVGVMGFSDEMRLMEFFRFDHPLTPTSRSSISWISFRLTLGA
jgi:hypothetical protein